MANKAEELREKLMEPVETWIASIEGEWSVDLTHEKVDFESVLDSIISAAHAEGVVEGTEQERERMVFILDDYERHHCSPFLGGIRSLLSLPIYDWHTHSSVLAPTKESEK